MPRPRLSDPKYKLVRVKGRRNWYVSWTEAGKTRLSSTSVEVDPEGEEPSGLALAALDHFVAARNTPIDPTIEELLDRRMAYWKAKKPRSKQAISVVKSYHDQLKDFFGHLQPTHIVPAKVIEYHEHREKNSKRSDGKKPLTAITRELEELRTTFLYAQRNRWIDDAPEIDMPAKRPPRDVYMTREEARKLVGAAKSKHTRLFIRIALATGQRHGAILDLTWDRVDLDRGILNFTNPEIEETKKRRSVCAVEVSLVAELKEAFESKKRKTNYVIEVRGKRLHSIKKAFELVVIKAGLLNKAAKPWVTPHVCKHTVISWLAESDWSIERISDFTATDIPTVRRIYRKVNPRYLAGMVETLSDALRVPEEGVSANGVQKNEPAPEVLSD